MKPLLVTSGEPAGIGPDICLELEQLDLPVVVLGDIEMLQARAAQLKKTIQFCEYQPGIIPQQGKLCVWHLPCTIPANAGQLAVENAGYVLNLLSKGLDACLKKDFSALVTAPIHKGIINKSGFQFSGHTEFLADRCQSEQVVMMLACPAMRIALVTTHLPLEEVPKAINEELIVRVCSVLHKALQHDFNIPHPAIYVAGLNPHAGENGYLGKEELTIINPALQHLRQLEIDVRGSYAADTLFSPENLRNASVFLTMYHDQGLPVLKYAGFGEAVNVTLGLPIIRTSVDHGTALELAGSGKASASSLRSAVKMAYYMTLNRDARATH